METAFLRLPTIVLAADPPVSRQRPSYPQQLQIQMDKVNEQLRQHALQANTGLLRNTLLGAGLGLALSSLNSTALKQMMQSARQLFSKSVPVIENAAPALRETVYRFVSGTLSGAAIGGMITSFDRIFRLNTLLKEQKQIRQQLDAVMASPLNPTRSGNL